MDYWGALALLAAAHTLGVISPGPNFLLVSSTAMQQSRRTGVAAGLGITAGSLTWSVLTISGIGLIIAQVPVLAQALRWLGAAYLIWLGGKMVWNAGAPMRPAAPETGDAWASARKGWLVNMTNPKSFAYFASVYGVMLPSHAPVWVYGAAIGITASISAIWYCGVAWLLSGEAARRAFLDRRKLIEIVIGLLLAGLGLRMLELV